MNTPHSASPKPTNPKSPSWSAYLGPGMGIGVGLGPAMALDFFVAANRRRRG